LTAGNYFRQSGEIDIRIWGFQLVIWIVVVILVKAVILFIELAFRLRLLSVSHMLLSSQADNSFLKTLIVMFICPLFCNSIQLLLFDQTLKKKFNSSEQLNKKILQKHFYTGTNKI
jgi:hypothetical protein